MRSPLFVFFVINVTVKVSDTSFTFFQVLLFFCTFFQFRYFFKSLYICWCNKIRTSLGLWPVLQLPESFGKFHTYQTQVIAKVILDYSSKSDV